MARHRLTILIPALLLAPVAQAYDSGSTGADGAFYPTASTTLTLPDNGVFNFTDVNIPAGVTVTFKKNAANTPAVILSQNDIIVNGTISVNGNKGSGALPGTGGPGGYDGGTGGNLAGASGQPGMGPGGGETAKGYYSNSSNNGCQGGHASYGNAGEASVYCATKAGATYGSNLLLPLVGGSGGGGGSGSATKYGGGGGGGGGALLLAANNKVSLVGSVTANGGAGASDSNVAGYGYGGHGSGGAVRVVAETVEGNGTLSAGGYDWNNASGNGRIRIEARTNTRTSYATPAAFLSTPNPVSTAALPSMRIATIGGVAVPAAPTGYHDVTLPDGLANPVTVSLSTSGVPVGSTVKLRVAPETGLSTTVNATVSGSESAGTANASATLPDGNTVLSATVTFTVTVAQARELAPYAGGEAVERVELLAGLGGGSAKLYTASGKEYLLPQGARLPLAQ